MEAGRLDVDELPDDTDSVFVNGVPAWLVTAPQGEQVVLLQRGPVVMVIVGAQSDAVASDVANGPPASAEDETLTDRMTAAGRGLLETFGLRG